MKRNALYYLQLIYQRQELNNFTVNDIPENALGNLRAIEMIKEDNKITNNAISLLKPLYPIPGLEIDA